jgi:inhibitor of cysteine peptidase
VDLRAFAEEARARQGGIYRNAIMEDSAAGAPAPALQSGEKAATPQTGGGSDGDYSQTNVQVEGVDEADIVKTDGEYLYVVRNADKSTVRIVKVKPANALQEVATIDMGSGETGAYAQDLYIDGDTLVVIAQRSFYHILPILRDGPASSKIAPDYYPGPSYTPRTDVRIYDVSNAANPSLKRTLSFDGTSVSTRRIGAKLYLVLNQPTVWNGPIPLSTLKDTDVLPQVEDSKTGKTTAVARCNSVVILPHIPQPQYLTVAVIPTDTATGEVKTSVVLGSAENVYSSLKNLYVASTEWNYNWNAQNPVSTQKTNIYRFGFTDAGAEMQAQGSVPGRILNQFSMDEHENTFRIATTVDGQWRADGNADPSRNNLYVLNNSMTRAGAIEDIAPGEQIYSVRFLGDRAYMVTFKKIDPFFVIDLSDPRKPSILGKLKIPGYSDYLHPYDENHIIGFGKEAVEAKQGDFAWYQGMKLAVFDVTDVGNPRELHKVVIGDRGTDSPLLHNHKALLFEKDRNLLAFPVTVHKISEEQKRLNPDGSAYGSPVFQGAYVYDFSLQNGFKQLGSITHIDDPETFTKAGDYWYDYTSSIERIVRVGESLLTISQKGVQANAESDLKAEGRMEFSK